MAQRKALSRSSSGRGILRSEGGAGGREAYANAAEMSELTMSELDLDRRRACERPVAGVSRTERERRQREREQERNRERCVVS